MRGAEGRDRREERIGKREEGRIGKRKGMERRRKRRRGE